MSRRFAAGVEPRRARLERGQVLVLAVLAMSALLAMLGLIVDGGQAFARQRMTQNATDSAAEAGAIVIARRLMGESPTDAQVLGGINAALAANGAELAAARYRDSAGADAGEVGTQADGTIPTGAIGVMVTGRQAFRTFFAGIVGIPTMSVSTDAGATAGYIEDVCSGDAGCALLPVAVPVTSITCDNQGDIVSSATPWPVTGEIVEIPLCKTGPGNVGWIDWRPPSGGTSELADSITSPDNPALSLPGWYLTGATGNVNSAQVESALRAFRGELLTVPLVTGSCDIDPGVDGTGTPRPCPAGSNTGHGQTIYYQLTAYTGFRLCGPGMPGCVTGSFGDVSLGAYISGNPTACTARNNTSCLFGRFEQVVMGGGLGAGGSSTRAVGIQLTH